MVIPLPCPAPSWKRGPPNDPCRLSACPAHAPLTSKYTPCHVCPKSPRLSIPCPSSTCLSCPMSSTTVCHACPRGSNVGSMCHCCRQVGAGKTVLLACPPSLPGVVVGSTSTPSLPLTTERCGCHAMQLTVTTTTTTLSAHAVVLLSVTACQTLLFATECPPRPRGGMEERKGA